MNIVFLLNSPYPYYTGGRETWLYNVSQRLCERHQVYIIVERPSAAKTDFGRFSGIDARIHFLYSSDLRNSRVFSPLLHSYLVHLNEEIMVRSMWKALKHLLVSVRGEKCFLISMDTVYTGKIGVWAKQKFPNVVFINSVRGPHADILGEGRPLLSGYFHKRESESLAAADQIWSNGWDTQETLRAQGFSSVVMKNGIDTSRALQSIPLPEHMAPPNMPYHILTIGTLQDVKGYAELIRAIGLLKREHGVLVGLTAFGKGDPAKYQKIAQEESVEEQIHFAGVQSQTVEYARSFDLVACLSGGGGLSMACLEALLSGTPVIAWDSPIYRQMIEHGKSGYLVKEWDIHALAEGILWMTQHPEEGKQMGSEARASVQRFDWNCIVHEIEAHLQEV